MQKKHMPSKMILVALSSMNGRVFATLGTWAQFWVPTSTHEFSPGHSFTQTLGTAAFKGPVLKGLRQLVFSGAKKPGGERMPKELVRK